MIKRILAPSTKSSFFVFGARGTGKSTFVQQFVSNKCSLTFNLLDPEVEDQLARSPKRLEAEILGLPKKPDWIVIDEIQKVPRLLDIAHKLIEEKKLKFIFTGSSARKLKRGSANLLAGRAFWYDLFPLTSLELGEKFQLIEYLHWGGLPRIQHLKSFSDRQKYLQSYVLTYLNEEIRAEQIVRNLDPFRNFLEIAAQASGKIINHKKIADDVGVTSNTIHSYFQILEDTLLGFYLPSFHLSIRKSQRQNPKFYLFDVGIKKALEGSLEQKPVPRTSVFGELFESMLLLEIYRKNKYLNRNFKLSFFATKNDSEIDLVLTKGQKNILIEIKSSNQIDETEIRSLARTAESFPNVSAIYYLSQYEKPLELYGVKCRYWRDFLKDF